ncbi:hypothetical protein NX84_00620 [Corynebacterium minutissimum]|nr:hypothetical protein NX84_00620 [Corynebacterium minutissimum]
MHFAREIRWEEIAQQVAVGELFRLIVVDASIEGLRAFDFCHIGYGEPLVTLPNDEEGEGLDALCFQAFIPVEREAYSVLEPFRRCSEGGLIVGL